MPSKEIIFLPKALNEAIDAYTWYKEKEAGLGDDFYSIISCHFLHRPEP